MKSRVITLITFLLLFSGFARGQEHFGIKGGLNFNQFQDISDNVEESWSRKSGYHFGVTYLVKVPFMGLAVQPDLLFVRKRSENLATPPQSLYVDYLTLPLNIQFGLDLLLFRPFIMVSPYLSYAVAKGDLLSATAWRDLDRLDYGYGIGGGIDLWKLQISGKYIWGLGKLQEAKMEGFHLSVAWMF